AGHAFVQRDPAAERRKRVALDGTRDLHLVLALVTVARMEDALRPLSVIGEQDEPLRIGVEPAHGVEALARAQERHDAAPSLFVARGRPDATRLVQDDVPTARQRPDRPA